MQYVDTDYIESGHFESIEIAGFENRRIGFVVDKRGLSEFEIIELLKQSRGEAYADEVNIIFGSDVKIAHRVDGAFRVSSIAGVVSDTIEQRISTLENASVDVDSIKASLLSSSDFLNAIASRFTVNIVVPSGATITPTLVFDEAKNAYVLDYDTSMLDGTDYTIEFKLV